MKIPILTYHSMKIHGNDYAANDLVALASDLETVRARGFRIAPLQDLVQEWLRDPGALAAEKVVAITCDDGGDFDFHDLPHPTAGTQRSVLNILRDFHARHAGSPPHVTTFVIVSPEARVELDKTCMIGKGWWNDTWWREAAASGFMHVANHSWDHNHDALPARFSHGVKRGTFTSIASRGLADLEIRDAREYLHHRSPNPGDALFAYPYGEWNDYLVERYFPDCAAHIGIMAAVGDEATYFSPGSNRWKIPRFVFGRDWKSPQELERILDGAAG
jgi:peptidoglycan/xylan/chitin deacetylase (PgdA/CDA1 family)